MRRALVLRSIVAASVFAIAALVITPAAAQTNAPLFDNDFHCSDAQAAFGGPQPAVAGQTLTVNLSTSCYFVVSVTVPAGESIQLTYLSGQYDAINLAFYDPAARPGASFHDPADARLGAPTAPGRVPGSGPTDVWVVLQGVGGPAEGTAALRIGTAESTTTTTVAPSTTVAPTTTADVAVETTTADVAVAADTADETTTTATPEADATAATDDDASATTNAPTATASSSDAAEADSGGGLPWWLLGVAILAALGWLAWLGLRARRPAPAAPWDRARVTWTLQHTAPTGSCSSSARALVDPDDDGMFTGYSITNLFALPRTGKKVRTTVDPELLNQLDTIWANGGSGEELRSSVEAYVNALCRQLHKKKAPADATLLTELTKSDVVVHGQVHSCVEGAWQMFEGWRDVPELPEGQLQHDIVQVAVLGVGDDTAESWLDRADDLTRELTVLIESRRAPAGLWVFD